MQLSVNKEEVVFPVPDFRLFLNDCHITLLIVDATPAQIPNLTRGPLDQMNQAKGLGDTSQIAQLARHNERAYGVPGRGHNLCGR